MTVSLPEIITVQEFVKTPDGGGGFFTSTADKFTGVRARVFSTRGKAAYEANRVGERLTYRITVRKQSIVGITPDMTVLWDGKLLSIDSVPDVARNAIYRDIIAVDRPENE